LFHPVVEHIDLENPYFVRNLIRRCSDGDHECQLRIWLPVQMDDGCWVSAVHIINLETLHISGMPGGDPLGALLCALAFARDVVDHRDGVFLFSDANWESAGLPISLMGVSTPRELAAMEAQALAMKFDAIEAFNARISNPPAVE
jgi:hypothetical protein